VRFPPLLELWQDVPAKFQRLVAEDFPFAEVGERVLSIKLMNEGAGAGDPRELQRIFKFRSEDSKMVISLESELLALTTSEYRRWEIFLPKFRSVLEAFFTVYSPPMFNRVGLRFQSVLNRELVQMAGASWRDLISHPVLATAEYFADTIDELPAMEIALMLDIDPGKLRVHLNTVHLNAVGNDKKEVGFLIDTDCFVDSEKFRSVDEVIKRIERLHGYSGRIFQACITEAVHNKLQPEPVTE
jgi:uncharacterized protein (TIGR04255 family)